MNKFRFGEDPFLDKLIREQEINIKKEKYDNLLKFLHGNAENLRLNMHIPITNDCRINENSFKRIIPPEEIEADKKKIEKIKDSWINPEKNKNALGEKMEVFKTALFQKFMGENYITIRSSEFDDIINHADNVIIDKKTGNVVSAFDEVMVEDESFTFSNERKTEKMAKIKRLNQEGIHLKYGIRLVEQINPKTKIQEKVVKADKETKVPIFCLSLSRKELQKGIENFDDEKISHNIFNSFMSNLNEQMEETSSQKNISENLINKINDFKKSLKEKGYIQ